MPEKRKKALWKVFAGIIAIISLIASAYYSFKSFTGYVTSEDINAGFNLVALCLFIAGIGGAYLFSKK